MIVHIVFVILLVQVFNTTSFGDFIEKLLKHFLPLITLITRVMAVYRIYFWS